MVMLDVAVLFSKVFGEPTVWTRVLLGARRAGSGDKVKSVGELST